MAVVAAAGVLGQIVSVSARTAKVLLLTDSLSAVDVISQRSRTRGIVSGSLTEGAVMKYVKRSEDLQVGDPLITSGIDGVFPKGVPVGRVEKVYQKGYGLFQHVTVALAADPTMVEELLVVSSGDVELRE
jgi:rod shape-determining protein MreC